MQIPDQALPFHISRSGFKYLGINITSSFKNLFDGNFAPLIAKLESDLRRWDILHLTLAGRVNCVKMNILPRFLFLFQCVPIYLTKSFFCQIDKLISGFIWSGKNPRICKEFLQRPRTGGGLALPNFRGYYWAANVHKITHWMQSPGTDWCELKGRSCMSSSLQALASSNLPIKISQFTSNPILLCKKKERKLMYIWINTCLNNFSVKKYIKKKSQLCAMESELCQCTNDTPRHGRKQW